MRTLPVFAYNLGFSLRRTRQDLFSRIRISEFCVLTPIAIFSSALVGAPSGLRKEFPKIFKLVSKGMLFPTPFRVREFSDVVGFIKIICQMLI